MDPYSSTKCSTDIMMLHIVLFGIEWHPCISILFKSKMSKFDFINISNWTTYRCFYIIQRHTNVENLHVSCVSTKAHLQPDRKYSDTVNLYPWEFQSGSASYRWSFWTSKSIRNEHVQKVTWMKSNSEKFCAGTRARIGNPSTVWYDVVGCKRIVAYGTWHEHVHQK